ncbi:leucyl aminopeptidase [Corynebacterium sp. H128]|uniref:leucyl aminopeptidase n=1 Tax=unclassified Corynebacterium TaxID=2624378 RepID=UPI0030A6A9F5
MPKQLSLPATGAMPKLSISAKLPKKTEAVLIPIFSGESGAEIAATGVFKEKTEVAILEALTALGASGKSQEITKLTGLDDSVPVIVTVGLGDSEDFDAEQLRRCAGVASRALKGFGKVASTLGTFGLADAVIGSALGAYSFRGQKTSKQDKSAAPVGELVFISDKKAEFKDAVILVESVALARDLVNTASSHLYPQAYADIIAGMAADLGIAAEILNEKDLAKNKFGGILAVGNGSARKPRLLRLRYEAKKSAPTVALVGKGITFDTGGISLKPGAKMDDMISDMGGSAAAIAATIAAARLGIKVNVTATIPMAENMPDGESYRPGDVVTHYGGKTSEILNTDAEGRLVLADAMARAAEDKPDYLMDMATLTGAQLVALGARTTGVMGTEQFRDRVAELGREVGEPAWAMPLIEELADEMKSDVADLRNIGKTRFGGMMQAGYFLSQFVPEDVQWVHLDIAGPAYNTAGAYGYIPTRGTGAPVRTIVAVLQELAS